MNRALVIILCTLCACMLQSCTSKAPSYSGTIEGTLVPVQTEAGGRVMEMLNEEGTTVGEGDVVARLEDKEAQVSLARAESILKQAQANEAERNINVRQAGIDIYKRDVELAKIALDKTILRAPQQGQIVHKHAVQGQIVAAGARLYTIMDSSKLWIRIYVPQSELPKVSLGQKAVVKVEALPDQPLQGVVDFISQKPEFTPKNVLSQEERSKLVYAVKVKLEKGEAQVKAGMSASVALTP